MKFATNHWEQVGHFYAHIAFYDGKVLKYQGIVTEANKQHLIDTHQGGIILSAYKGDRIRADDYSAFGSGT